MDFCSLAVNLIFHLLKSACVWLSFPKKYPDEKLGARMFYLSFLLLFCQQIFSIWIKNKKVGKPMNELDLYEIEGEL